MILIEKVCVIYSSTQHIPALSKSNGTQHIQ